MKRSLITTLIISGILLIGYIVFRNISMKEGYFQAIYDFVEPQVNVTGNVKLSMPMFSYNEKEEYLNDFQTITFNNLRSKRVIEKEIENHLSTYKLIECNEKEYYYNETHGYTIVDYDLKNNFFWSKITYKFVFGNYCEKQEQIPNNGVSPQVSGNLKNHRGDVGYFYTTTDDYVVYAEEKTFDKYNFIKYTIQSFGTDGVSDLKGNFVKLVFESNNQAKEFVDSRNGYIVVDNVVYISFDQDSNYEGLGIAFHEVKNTLVNDIKSELESDNYFISKP